MSWPRPLGITIDILCVQWTKVLDGQRNGTTVPPLSAFPCFASVSLCIARSIPPDRVKPFGVSNRP